jgi:hypothetical protein
MTPRDTTRRMFRALGLAIALFALVCLATGTMPNVFRQGSHTSHRVRSGPAYYTRSKEPWWFYSHVIVFLGLGAYMVYGSCQKDL